MSERDLIEKLDGEIAAVMWKSPLGVDRVALKDGHKELTCEPEALWPLTSVTYLLATIARLSEALAEAEKKGAEDWQPIETAPRDGTEFIAYREDQGLFACRWMSAEELAPKNWDGDPIGDYPEGRADWWHDVWGWLAGDEAPTLWQAYPAPPRDISQGGQP